MDDGIPANTNPFLVLISWNWGDGDPEFHKIVPEYFGYDDEATMPMAKEVIKPPITQTEAEALVRKVAGKNQALPLAVHEKFGHIIPCDLRKIVRVARPFSNSHSKKGFYIPLCTDDESYYLK
ncbi:MAG: hypothetical protein Q7S83_00085 [bacterium]|nr:hypothetical protein [bacterium]